MEGLNQGDIAKIQKELDEVRARISVVEAEARNPENLPTGQAGDELTSLNERAAKLEKKNPSHRRSRVVTPSPHIHPSLY